MHAYVDDENHLRREDGKPFRLFDSVEHAAKAALYKNTAHKIQGDIDVVKVGDKFALRVKLPEGKTQAAERQVRHAINRGMKHAKDKASLTVTAVRPNGKKVPIHAGEITALGLTLDAGSTQNTQDKFYANPQVQFLNGLAYLIDQHDFTIDFRPADEVVDGKITVKGRASDANKLIYGQVAYKDAIPDQKRAIPRTAKGKVKDKGYVEWAIDKFLSVDAQLSILKGLLFNYGFLSNEEIAQLERTPVEEQRTVLEGLALVQSTIRDDEGIQVRDVRQPLALEEDQDISEESLHLPTEESRKTKSGREVTDPLSPKIESIGDKSLGYNQHGKPEDTGMVQNYITKWPAAKIALEFVMKKLNLNEKVVLFDEDSASLLHQIYRMEEFAKGNSKDRTALYRRYRKQIERVLRSNTPGRVHPLPKYSKNMHDDRVVLIFVSKTRRTENNESRGLILMHELGHLVQYTHLDRLSPDLRQQVLDGFGYDTDQQNRDAFANWMAKVASDIFHGERVRPGNNEVNNIFVKIVQDLKALYDKLKKLLKYPKPFDEFVAALNEHSAKQRGELATVPKTEIARRMFSDLEETENGGLIPLDVAAPPTDIGSGAPKVERRKIITRGEVRDNPDKIYVFGDNDKRAGLGGQAAAMRGEPNAIGVRTKKAPDNKPGSFYSDAEFDANRQKIDEDFSKVVAQARAGKPIVIPEDGLGTGRARLGPRTLAYINKWIAAIETGTITKSTKKVGTIKPVPQKQTAIKFEESNSSDYLVRTLQNAKGADATIDFAKTTTGSGGRNGATKRSADKAGKVYINIIVDNEGRFDPKEAAKEIIKGLTFQILPTRAFGDDAMALNIAGHGVYSVGDNQARLDALVTETLRLVNAEIPIKSVRSGGQTGFDEAGAKAGVALGVPTTVLAPKGWKFRPRYREDVANEAAFKERFESEEDLDDFDDFSAEVGAAVEETQDPLFKNYVEDMQNWANTLQRDPIAAVRHLVYTSDGELRGMGRIGVRIADEFHALPVSLGKSNTVFRAIMMRTAPHFIHLQRILNNLPDARISLWESLFNKHPSAETKARQQRRKRINEALLLQTKPDQLPADIRDDVTAIRKYLHDLYRWYTAPKGSRVVVDGKALKGQGMKLKARGLIKESMDDPGVPTYFPLMVNAEFLQKNVALFDRIATRHGFSARDAQQIRRKIMRDEDGGLSTGFHDDVTTDEFFGPGAPFTESLADWPAAMRDDLVKAGFYQQDIATTLIAYTEMMTRRSVWHDRFAEHNKSRANIARYAAAGINIQGTVAKLQMDVLQARRSGDINKWQYQRIIRDILPAYAGQLGLRTNSHLRKLSAGIVIYQNLRLLPFAIFSQFVDVGTLLVRGDFQASDTALKALLSKSTLAEAKVMLEEIGGLRQGLTEHVLNDQALNTFMTGNAKRINDLFFRYNQMEGWTNLMRTLGLISGRSFIKRNAEAAQRGDATAQRYMNELDLGTPEQLAAAVAWDGHSTINEEINAALNRYIDEAMIRPDASIRPVWMSDPGYGIFAHLKGFLYGFHETFLRRVGREAKIHQNLLPLLALGIVALPFAAVGYELRRWVTTGGNPRPRPEGASYVVELFERAGLFGAWQLVMDMEQADEFGKPFALGVGGPAVEQLFDFYDRDLASWIPRAIPVVAGSPPMREWAQDQLE
jgi:hypothetical protein